MLKSLKEGTVQEKRDLMKVYIKRLADYQYLTQHPSFKQFIEKKMDIKKHITDAISLSNASYQNAPSSPSPLIGESNPFELAERLRESFAYLMEVPI
jgi:hypothetical protein